MTKKLISVLLCVALIFTLSVNVFANDTQTIPIVEENGSEIIEIENQSTRSATDGIINSGIYRIKNVASGKYMNVDYGIDANGTNIYQWTADGSTEQKFKVAYSPSTDSYMLYAMCSSNGTNRVVDVTRGSTPLTSGQNIKLYNPTDPTSQEIKIVSLGSNKYKLVMRANQNLAITSYGTSNGSVSGTTATSAGNIFISTYTGSTNQQWQFELLEIQHGSITLYGIQFPNQIARNVYYTDAVEQAISNIGVSAVNGIFNGVTADTALYRMKTSMIWVIHTHGYQQGIQLNHPTEGESWLEYEDIEALSNDAFASERCIIYGTCSAGEGAQGAENMVNITYQKGAMTVIGWTTTVTTVMVDTWLEAFLVSCGEGSSISEAMGDAITEVSDTYHQFGGLGNIYVRGSTTQKLIS